MRRPIRPSILLVEDDEIDILLFRRHAEKYGLDVFLDIAESAEDALKYLEKKRCRKGSPPVVLVTDLNMPGMGGHALIDSVRANPGFENMVIFVISTADSDKEMSLAYSKRIAGYIIKDPIGEKTEKCVQMLRAYCDSVFF